MTSDCFIEAEYKNSVSCQPYVDFTQDCHFYVVQVLSVACAFRVGDSVLTSTGWRAVETLQPGDEIVSRPEAANTVQTVVDPIVTVKRVP